MLPNIKIALYERIVNKGKRKKLVLIAVANKLLKQAFVIAKSGLPYDESFVIKIILSVFFQQYFDLLDLRSHSQLFHLLFD